MGIISDIRAAWAAPSVSDDGSWSTIGGDATASSSGFVITERAAMTNPVVFDCVNILMDAVGQSPTILYDRTGATGDERQRASSALAYRLREQPNSDQTAIEFKREMQQAASFYEFAYAEVTWRGAEPVEIVPRHPSRIRTVRLAGGRKRYEYREDDGTTWRPIVPANMLRVPGRPVLRYAGETLGRALALERYSSRLFAKGVRPSALISTSPEETWSETARQKLKDEIEANSGGPDKAGGVLIMDGRLKWTSMAMTNQEAELSALLSGIVGDLARWWRIPPYMIGLLESGTVSYASVNTQGVDFVVYCLMPWLVGWEQAMQRDLVVDKGGQFVEFLTAALLRGTTKERYEVYQVAINAGIMSVNEVRRLENLNPRQGGDVYLAPLNMSPAQGARHVEAGSPADRLLQALTHDAAGNVLRRETGALAKLAERAGPDAKAWEAGVREFYEGHAAYVSEKLKLPLPSAVAYAAMQEQAVLMDGPSVVATWATSRDREHELVALAMERSDPSIAASVIGGLRSEVRELRTRQPVNVSSVTTVEPAAPAAVTIEGTTVNVEPAAVTVQPPDVHVSSPVTVEGATVNVAAAEPPVVNVTNEIRAADAPAVQDVRIVSAPPVNAKVTRDQQGRMTGIKED